MKKIPWLKDWRRRLGAVPFVGNFLRTLRDYLRYCRLAQIFLANSQSLKDERFECSWTERMFCLGDATEGTAFDPHYLYHTAWAARILSRSSAAKHIDISSCLRFVTIVSAFKPVEFYDYRPASLNLDGLTAAHGDLLQLPFPSGTVDSISCMHVVEHIGLGRYGDPIDPKADLFAMKELSRVVRSGGELLFVVPVGQPRIIFNAHRIYAPEQILSYFPEFELKEFALINDDGSFLRSGQLVDASDLQYGCGCFHFVKMQN